MAAEAVTFPLCNLAGKTGVQDLVQLFLNAGELPFQAKPLRL